MFEIRKPKVSIVIPSWFTDTQSGKYGRIETYWIAQECLKRLVDVTPSNLYELIIIDNGSTLVDDPMGGYGDYDTTARSIKEEWLKLREYWGFADILIRNSKNLGFAPAVNQGINLARGEFVVVVNNDILFWDRWLETMLEDFEKLEKLNPQVGLLMPALYKEKESFHDTLKKEKKDVDMTVNAGQWGNGAEFGSCWMAKKELLMRVAKNRDGYQVMDENFKLGMGEDRWLYREVRMLGYETYRTHNLRVAHVGNATIGKVKDRKEYTSKNREYLQELKNKNNIN